jgi:hypothetical protein
MSDRATIYGGSWYYREPHVLERNDGGQVVLALPGSGGVAFLTPSTETVWRLLETPRTVVDLATSLARVYQGPIEDLATDVERLLEDLVARGVVQAVSDADD